MIRADFNLFLRLALPEQLVYDISYEVDVFKVNPGVWLIEHDEVGILHKKLQKF